MKKEIKENPYLSARRKWNEVTSDHIQAARNWRAVAISGNLVAIACAAGLIYVSSQQKVVPYIVELNEHSEPVRISRAEAINPSSSQIKAALRSWIVGVRTVYVDRRAQQDMIAAAYAMTAPDSAAYGSLAEYHKENNPYSISQEKTVEVAVNSVMPVSDDSWRIEWTETTKELSGRVVSTKPWQAVAMIRVIPPTEEKQIMVNPVGVYVENYSWAARL